MTAYFEVRGSRRYEYRYDDGTGFTGWQDAGRASPETLIRIQNGVGVADPLEVRQVCAVVDEAGAHAGELVFATLVLSNTGPLP